MPDGAKTPRGLTNLEYFAEEIQASEARSIEWLTDLVKAHGRSNWGRPMVLPYDMFCELISHLSIPYRPPWVPGAPYEAIYYYGVRLEPDL